MAQEEILAERIGSLLNGTPAPPATPAPVEPAKAASPAAELPAKEEPPASAPPGDKPPADKPTEEAPAEAEAAGDPDKFKFFDEDGKEKPAEAKAAADPVDDEEEARKEFEKEFGKDKASERKERIYTAFKTVRALEKPTEEGGLGRAPSVDEIKQWAQDSLDFNALWTDIQAGDREGAENFVKQILASPTAETKPGVMAIAEALPATLAKGDPDVYTKVAWGFAERILGSIDRDISQAETPSDRLALADLHRYLEFYLTGKVTKQYDVEALKSERKADPLADKTRELDARIKKLDDRDREAAQKTAVERGQAVEGAKEEILTRDTTRILDRLNELHKPSVFKAVRKEFLEEVRGAVKQDSFGRSRLQQLEQAARKSGSESDLKAVKDQFATMARTAITRIGKQYLQEAAESKTQQSAERHKTLSEAATKPSAGTPGQPSARSIAVAVEPKRPDESQQEFNTRRTLQLMRS